MAFPGDGPGDISIHSSGEIQPLKDWAGRKDKYRAQRTVEDAPQCPAFQIALEELFHSTVTFCDAFPREMASKQEAENSSIRKSRCWKKSHAQTFQKMKKKDVNSGWHCHKPRASLCAKCIANLDTLNEER